MSQDLNIRIATTADTSGAEDAAEAIQDVAAAAESAGESSQAADPQLERLINIQRAQVASQIAGVIGAMSNSLRRIGEESKSASPEAGELMQTLASGLDAVAQGVDGAAKGFAVGGPLGAAIGAMAGLIAGVAKPAFQGMIADLNNSNEAHARAVEMTKRLWEARRELYAELRSQKLQQIFEAELAAITASVDALNRREKIAAAERAASSAEARAGLGAGPQGTRQGITIDIQQQFAEIDAMVRKAEETAAAAAQAAGIMRERATQIARREGEMEDAAVQARERAMVAEQAAAKAAADAEAAAQIGAAQIREVFANFTGRFEEAAAEIEAQTAERVSGVLAKIRESGAELNQFEREAVAQVEGILADGRVANDELRTLGTAMQTLQASQKLNIDTILSIQREGFRAIQDQNAQIRALQQTITDIRAQMGDLARK